LGLAGAEYVAVAAYVIRVGRPAQSILTHHSLYAVWRVLSVNSDATPGAGRISVSLSDL